MTEKELAAKNVRAMVDALNNAIALAANVGLSVELNSAKATAHSDKVQRVIYSPRIYEENEFL